MNFEEKINQLLKASARKRECPDDLFKRELFEQLKGEMQRQTIGDPFFAKLVGTKRYEWLRFQLKFNPLATLVPVSTIIAIFLRLIFNDQLAVWVAWLVGGVR